MALTTGQKQEVQALLATIDRLSGLLAAERLYLAELEARQAAGHG